jgi:hypothetical protein
VFAALNAVLERRPDLAGSIELELVGPVAADMLATPAASRLPAGLLRHVPHVTYVESLEKMYDADILLLIEADVPYRLFVPSKISDYLGADRPIVGVAPPGGALDMLDELGCRSAHPRDVERLASILSDAVDDAVRSRGGPGYDEAVRRRLSGGRIAELFSDIIQGR